MREIGLIVGLVLFGQISTASAQEVPVSAMTEPTAAPVGAAPAPASAGAACAVSWVCSACLPSIQPL